jgi:Aerotolerance regulator N-terminal/von Willebrand factor type A domain
VSFLYPAFLIGSIAIALPIVLHLLRRDVAPEVPFTAVRLLRRSPVERPARRRLRELILLAARVLALLLLAAAFARPYVQGSTPSTVSVVAIDRSYSMSGGDRFERALDLARQAIDRAGRDRIAVIAFDERADVLAQPGGAADARSALQNAAPGFGATRYEPVFAKALDLAAGAPGRLTIVTDLQRIGWDGEVSARLPIGWQLDVQDIGAVQTNVAIAAVSIENGRVVATLRNSGGEQRTGSIRATLDGKEVVQSSYSVPARGTAEVPLAWRPPASGALEISIDDANGLIADDARYVLLGGRGTVKALVVTSGGQSGLYLTRALATSAGEDDALEAETASGARVAEMTPEKLAEYPVLALLSTRGVERPAREAIVSRVMQGAGLLLAAGPDLDAGVASALTNWQPAWDVQSDGAATQGATTATMTFAPTDLRHPIFRPFGALAANLGQVRFDRTWKIAPDGWSVLARFSNSTPALLERPLGRGRVVLFASDIDRRWNDFPLHPAFVPFALEAVRHAGGGSASRHPGDYTVAQAPPGTGPSPGVYKAADGRIVSVNVDTRESAPERVTKDGFVQMVQRSPDSAPAAAGLQARQTESRQSYWQYGLVIMLAALVAESFVGRR